MIDLFNVYDCPKCGKRLSDGVETIIEIEIDNEHDEVYEMIVCVRCGNVVKPRVEDGVQVMEQVSHERWLWATGYYDD